MKIIVANWVFNAAMRTVTFTDYPSISLNAVLAIVNLASNTVIYDFVDTLKSGTVAGNVLTLTYNTTAMNNNDALRIYYDDESAYLAQIVQIVENANVWTEEEKNQVVDKTRLIGSMGATVDAPTRDGSDVIFLWSEFGFTDAGGAALPIVRTDRVASLSGATVKLRVHTRYGVSDKYIVTIPSDQIAQSGGQFLITLKLPASNTAKIAVGVYVADIIAEYAGGDTVALANFKIRVYRP